MKKISEPETPSFRAWNTQFQGLEHPVSRPGTPSFKRLEHPVSNAWNTQFQGLEHPVSNVWNTQTAKKRQKEAEIQAATQITICHICNSFHFRFCQQSPQASYMRTQQPHLKGFIRNKGTNKKRESALQKTRTHTTPPPNGNLNAPNHKKTENDMKTI